ncbi:response regulator transcription factor [Sphingobium lignivorans]|uniref:DNA-binding response OmpR family regulator n=1 Tax=Sphingobium lignivorans TaxID=2735886 RepID=A0ABR6NA98_9SPHN|nr:DNA-binding response OmpR family regulator [Sphingobium lignivorans]
MQRIEIWLCHHDDARDRRLAILMRALRRANVAVHLRTIRPKHAGTAARSPDNALCWQRRDDVRARIRILAAGAVDVIGPWMSEGEALARSLRHARAVAVATPFARPRVRLGELEIDLMRREAWRLGRPLGLVQREFELLHCLALHPGRPQTREALLWSVWGVGFDPGTNVVQVHVSRLRAKLDRDFDWQMLRTMRGVGYALVARPRAPGAGHTGAAGTPILSGASRPAVVPGGHFAPDCLAPRRETRHAHAR